MIPKCMRRLTIAQIEHFYRAFLGKLLSQFGEEELALRKTDYCSKLKHGVEGMAG